MFVKSVSAYSCVKIRRVQIGNNYIGLHIIHFEPVMQGMFIHLLRFKIFTASQILTYKNIFLNTQRKNCFLKMRPWQAPFHFF